MNYESKPGQFAETMGHLYRHWESKRRAESSTDTFQTEAAKAFTIALSREAGTLGTSVAREVGKQLGWQVYDQELLQRIAQDMGLQSKLLESVDERQQSWLVEVLEAVLLKPSVSETSYVHRLVQTVLALGAHGECIIVGRGSPFILPAESTLRVRLVAPEHDRVRALGHRLGLSDQEAARQVKKLDQERTSFVKQHFFKDPNDPSHYDLLVNAARWSAAGCAELIVSALHQMQAHAQQSERALQTAR